MIAFGALVFLLRCLSSVLRYRIPGFNSSFAKLILCSAVLQSVVLALHPRRLLSILQCRIPWLWLFIRDAYSLFCSDCVPGFGSPRAVFIFYSAVGASTMCLHPWERYRPAFLAVLVKYLGGIVFFRLGNLECAFIRIMFYKYAFLNLIFCLETVNSFPISLQLFS